jgi:hypothetical protein
VINRPSQDIECILSKWNRTTENLAHGTTPQLIKHLDPSQNDGIAGFGLSFFSCLDCCFLPFYDVVQQTRLRRRLDAA